MKPIFKYLTFTFILVAVGCGRYGDPLTKAECKLIGGEVLDSWLWTDLCRSIDDEGVLWHEIIKKSVEKSMPEAEPEKVKSVIAQVVETVQESTESDPPVTAEEFVEVVIDAMPEEVSVEPQTIIEVIEETKPEPTEVCPITEAEMETEDTEPVYSPVETVATYRLTCGSSSCHITKSDYDVISEIIAEYHRNGGMLPNGETFPEDFKVEVE